MKILFIEKNDKPFYLEVSPNVIILDILKKNELINLEFLGSVMMRKNIRSIILIKENITIMTLNLLQLMKFCKN